MNAKLTLRLDENLIRSARLYSAKTGQSISKIVADYFALIDVALCEKSPPASPITSTLRGCLKSGDQDVSEEDYKRHIESKYL